MRIEKRVQVVTGGAGGMGLAICKRIANRGPLFVVDISQEKLDIARKQLTEAGIVDASYVCCDISDKAQVESLVFEVEKAGHLGSVIHTAAYSPVQTNAQRILEVDACGTIYVMDSFYRLMEAGSSLINIVSVAGHMLSRYPDTEGITALFEDPQAPDFSEKLKAAVGDNAGLAYVASKNFCMHYTKRNTLRWAKKGARILSVSAGCFTTPMGLADMPGGVRVVDNTPLARWGHPDEIAAVIEFLSSDEASYVTGVDLLVDGGFTTNTTFKQFGQVIE